MSSIALSPTAVNRSAVNPWLIAGVVLVPTFMEVLDTTIANVALRYIAGGLSAAQTDSEWVITTYLAANAIVLPITGWLSAHLGRRNYFLLSIAVFTLASALCGMATTLAQIIMFRGTDEDARKIHDTLGTGVISRQNTDQNITDAIVIIGKDYTPPPKGS